MLEALEFPFFQRALVAGLLASVACGVVGTYVVVKKMASISGGISHAAFGGVGLGYFLGFEPMIGATIFALVGAAGVSLGHHRMRTSIDTLIAILWPVGMALGIIFISLTPGYAPDLLSYLFGSILFVPASFLKIVAAYDVVILLGVAILFKELQAVAFDEEQARIMKLPVDALLIALFTMIALAVVVLIQVVGVILVIALLTIPPVIARQWSESLGKMMILATVAGAVSTTLGLFIAYGLSASYDLNIPTGPLIILLAFGMLGASTLARRVAN